ncbi:MAG TPA: hypothetical protein VGO61_13285 [Steroidobacteraceae bacterium]|nr:hypothetical protein [Steroidobacteraceae bacterium]
MHRKIVSLLLVLMTALPLAAAPAHADDKPKKVKYVPPGGFGGHAWGELRTNAGFDRLPKEPVGVGAAWMRPVEKESSFTCVPVGPPGPTMSGAVGGCDFQATLLQLRKTFEGGGFYVLSEYTIEDQGFRYGGETDGVVLHPVIYQFCANWDETKREVPPKFDEINKFCGVRFLFQSDTREQLRKQPADYLTNYDRVLERLLAKFGRPDNFVRRGQVVIETMDGDSYDPSERKFSIWRWCPARDRALHTTCTASVVLSLEPATGVGTVLYSTPLLWEFAYARENNGYKGDKLFKMLHAGK